MNIAARRIEPGRGTAPAEQLTDSRKVYILPTRYGLLFAAAVLTMLLVSVNYNNGLGHLFTFLLVGVGIVSMHYTQRNLVGIRFAALPGKPVFAGESAQATVTLRDSLNRARQAVCLRGGTRDVMIDLEAGGHADVALVFATDRRGLRPLPGSFLVSIYPMGLFCAWTRSLPGASRQMIYPKPAPPTPLPTFGSGEGSDNDVGARARPGDSDFRGLREHQLGDPSSRVHWRGSARGTGLKTKLFEGEGVGRIDLRWSDTGFREAEARLSVLCRWVLDAEAGGLCYALELPGVRIDHGNGARHRQRCLESLALWTEPR